MISTQWPDGWRGHEQQQLERQRSWTFAQKLQWLEDAHKMVLQIEKARAATTPNARALNADTSSTRTSSTRIEAEDDLAAKTQL